VEIPGPLRIPYSFHHAEFEIGWKALVAFANAQYADRKDPVDPDVYDLWSAGSVSPLSFGNELWMPQWRHLRYGVLGGGLHSQWQGFGFRLVGGTAAYLERHEDGSERENDFPFWEAGISIPSFLGPWRLSCGGFNGFGPFAALQWGYNLDLDHFLLDAEL
jgi:hypothetical protein